MYFDLTSRKFQTLVALCVVLSSVFVLSPLVVRDAVPLLIAARDYSARERADAAYWISFKLPGATRVALAAVAGTSVYPGGASTTPLMARAQNVPVLLYHGEGVTAPMSEATFVAQMRALKADGWRTITMAQFEAYMRGSITLPDKSFLLTFDDGRSDTFYSADPVLADLGFHAVMFVITGFSMPGNANQPTGHFYLSKAQLAYMTKSGRWDLESHGDLDHAAYSVPSASSTAGAVAWLKGAHFMSNRFWDATSSALETQAQYRARLMNDLSTAKRELEQDFGIAVDTYAYPFNDFGEDTVNDPDAGSTIGQVVTSLYSYAFYQTWPGDGDSFNYAGHAGQGYLIKRVEPGVDWTGADLLATLDAGREKALPYASSSFGAEWRGDWGIIGNSLVVSSRGGSPAVLAIASPSAPALSALPIRAATTTTGGAAFLDGTENWRDYALSTQVRVAAGTLLLIARHAQSDDPYLACAFSQDRVYLELHQGSTQTTVASARYAPPPEPGVWNDRMSVAGAYATCSAYGVSVSGAVPTAPARGGIGVSVWDQQPGAAHLDLTRISATAL